MNIIKIELKTQNEKIINFYKKYSSLKFEEVNLMMVDLFEKILNNASGIIDNSILNGILSNIKETATNTQQTLNKIQNIQEIQKLSNEKHSSEIITIQSILKNVSNNLSII